MENLKNGTKIKRGNQELVYEYDNLKIVYSDEIEEDFFKIYNLLTLKDKFEILSEEDEEIDIDSITKIYINDIKSVGESETKCWTGRSLDIVFANKINKLIKAVKKLDKKIKEKEND